MAGRGALGAPIRRRASWVMARRVRWPREARRLRRSGGPVGEAVALALAATQRRELEREEAELARQVEALRHELEPSSAEISIPAYADFRRLAPMGAGAVAEPEAEARIPTTVGAVTRSSKGPAYCRLLMMLVRELRPGRCLELGTCVGISAAYQAAALELNGEGRLVSVEGAPELARLAAANLDRLGLTRVEVRAQSFEAALAELGELSPIDFAFVDGDHTEEGTLASFRALRDALSDRGVIAFDDIRWSAGMRSAWSAISRKGMGTVADLGGIGLWSPAA